MLSDTYLIIARELEKGVTPGELSIDPTTLGLKAPDQYRSINIESITYNSNGIITVTFHNKPELASLADRTIIFVPELVNGRVSWRIDRERSTVPYRFLPKL